HLWRGKPRHPVAAAGFVVTLGDAAAADPRRAEIVSFPAGMSRDIRLTVEAEVTAAACGTTVATETFSVTGGSPATATMLTLAMPGCDAVGDYLVLNNLFDDLKLAAR